MLPSCCRFLWGRPEYPDQETATALFSDCDPSSRTGVAARGHLGQGIRPCFLVLTLASLPSPFPEPFTALGMVTVLPPVVAVKRQSLYIVSQSNDCADAQLLERFSTAAIR